VWELWACSCFCCVRELAGLEVSAEAKYWRYLAIVRKSKDKMRGSFSIRLRSGSG
jgi:hypothetical protein